MAVNIDNMKEATTGRFERLRIFLTEVRNELKRVTWPNGKEVYATTVVVILVSVFFGVYLFTLDFLFNSAVHWVLERFGAV